MIQLREMKKSFLNQMVHDNINCLSYLFFTMDNNSQEMQYVKRSVNILRIYEALFDNYINCKHLEEFCSNFAIKIHSNKELKEFNRDCLSVALIIFIVSKSFKNDFKINLIEENSFSIEDISCKILESKHGLIDFLRENYSFYFEENNNNLFIKEIKIRNCE